MLAALMISDVPYPTVPQIGFRTVRKIIGTIVVLGSVFLVLFRKEEFLFPALLAYVLYGAIKWVILGFLGRSSTPDEIFGVDKENARRFPSLRRGTSNQPAPMEANSEDVEDLLIHHGVDLPAGPEDDDDEEPAEPRRVQREEQPRRPPPEGGQPPRRKRRKRGRGGNRPHGSTPPGPPLPDSPTGPAE
jgi:hypothetical protein